MLAIYIKNITKNNVIFIQFNKRVSTITASLTIRYIIMTQKKIKKVKNITMKILDIIVKYNAFYKSDMA